MVVHTALSVLWVVFSLALVPAVAHVLAPRAYLGDVCLAARPTHVEVLGDRHELFELVVVGFDGVVLQEQLVFLELGIVVVTDGEGG